MPSPLRPEQLRALEYARRRGTEANLADIRARVAGTYAEIESQVASLPEEIARRHGGAGGWCVQEVVDHLVESDGPAAGQLAELLEGRAVTEPIPASLQSPAPHDLAWSALRERFGAVHADVLAVLATASDDSPQGATGAVWMVVKCAMPDGTVQPLSSLQRFDWKAYAILLHAHNREHMAQIRRILATPATEPVAGA